MANGSPIEQQFPPIDYTDRDYFTILEALQFHIQRKFPNDWKDFRDSAVGMGFMQMVAWAFDNISYYLDVRANEGFLPTAKDRISIINLGRLVGYKLAPATSASLLVTVTIADGVPRAKDVIIPVGTRYLSSTNNVPFEFLEEGRIPAGALSAQVNTTQGETETDSFVSDGSAFQRFKLTTNQVLDGTVIVEINTVQWTEVESLVFADETSTAFEVERDEDDFATILFGDGISGFVPSTGSVINVTYRVGGGVQGNLALNDVQTTITGFLEAVEPPEGVDLLLTNPDERGSGGEDRETIEHAQFFMPKSVKTNGRAVTREDFETLAALFNDPVFGAPSAASARLKQRIPELNTVEVFLWTRDATGAISDEPGSGLIGAVQDYFDNNGPGSVRIVSVDTEVQSGTNVFVDVTCRVRAASAFSPSQVVANASQAISDYFASPTLVRPGEDVRLSQLYDRIMSAQGVTYAIITNIRATLKVAETFEDAGDGTTVTFTHTTERIPVPGSILIETDGGLVVTDDKAGNLRGNVDPTGGNTVNYETGGISVTFDAPPAAGEEITVTYRYITTFQRGELEIIANGDSARFRGSLDFPPAVPGTVAFSDGTQVVIDDGEGNLIGDVYESGTIDYDTGFYDFTFSIAPPSGAELRTTYVQFLSTDSQDLPITRQQLAVESDIVVTPILEDTTD
jgi:uncharacterized phage protein gp47/JayE